MKKGLRMLLVAGLVLAAATPRNSGAQETFVAANYDAVVVSHVTNGSTVVKMLLPVGLYMAHAKLSIANFDGDKQSGHCNLWTKRGGAPTVHDVSQVRLGEFDGADTQIITLQSVISETPDTIETFSLGVYCSSFDANVAEAVLMATRIDAVHVPGPTPAKFPFDQSCPVCP